MVHPSFAACARLIKLPLGCALCIAFLALPPPAAAAPQDAKTRAGTADGSAPAAAQPAPTIADTLIAVRQIAHELRTIDERLGVLDKSVSGMNASLATVAAVTQPDQVKKTLDLAGDIAWERGRALILLGTACVGALMLLHALLRRWFGGYRGSRI